MKLWETGNISRRTMLEAHGIDVDMEYERKQREMDDGYDDVFVKPGTNSSAPNADAPEEENDGKIGRPRMDDGERTSDEENARTGAQPKPSNPDGSEPQEE